MKCSLWSDDDGDDCDDVFATSSVDTFTERQATKGKERKWEKEEVVEEIPKKD